MDAHQDKTSDNTILCILLFVILLIAVLWETHGMQALRAEFVRGFHEDLEYGRCVSAPAHYSASVAHYGVYIGLVHLLK